MKNKNIVFIILFIFTILGFIFIFSEDKEREEFIETGDLKEKKIKVAVCPTCYEITKKLNPQKYQIILTSSTAESVELIKNKRADLMISGRKLKPNEPNMEKIIIKKGYSFLGNQETSIYFDELKNYNIYTDLDVDVIKNTFSIKNIEKVNNVYNYLDKGVIITSWENTDYFRAKIIDVFEYNGKRVKLSRQPTIYCPRACDKEVQQIISLIK